MPNTNTNTDTIKKTRGGLVPAKVINLSTNETVLCMFNPFEYTLSKQNSWEAKAVRGKNVPKVEFKSGGKQSLKLTLHFDGLMEDKDVREFTDPLWRMMKVDENATHRESGKSQPPEVAFEWGRLYFRAVLTSMSQKFTLFKQDGTPVRCQIEVTLDQHIDVDDYSDQQPVATAQDNAQEVTVTAGDRLDHIAASTSSSIRSIAESNNIDNPQNIPPGSQLTVRPE